MPALNEEKNICSSISNVLDAFEDLDISGEIIVINDGSTDNTAQLIKEKIGNNANISILENEEPRGFGTSFWQGLDNAIHEAVIVIPGDNENDPWEILRYLTLLNHVDIVIPFVFNNEVRPIFRRVLSFLYRLIINITFQTNLNYTNGTVIYRKNILQQLKHRSAGFFFQTDILIRLLKKNYLFVEVPYKLNQREGGVSKAISFPSLFEVLKGYLLLFKDQHIIKSDHDQPLDDTKSQNRHKNINKKFKQT
jgi:glycosyltransferase involved in cell wall biosynthesis